MWHPLFGLFGVIAFFGGLVAGFRLAGWPRRLLLADRSIEEPAHWQWLVEMNRFAPAAYGIAWMALVPLQLQPPEWVFLTGGLQLALWTECLPYAVPAAVLGVWAEPRSKFLGGPADVIVTGRVRQAGLLGIGLTVGVTGGVFALRAAVG